jgi:hypothetical protein
MKRLLMFVLVLALVLVAAGCGPSAEETYFTNLTPAIEGYNTAMDGVSTQFNSLSAESLNDQAWMDATFAALDKLDSAGKAMGATPSDQVPEKWANLNDLLVQISDQNSLFVKDMKGALDAQDWDAMQTALNEYQGVITLFEQVQTELDAQ